MQSRQAWQNSVILLLIVFILADLATGLLINMGSSYGRIGLPIKMIFFSITLLTYLTRLQRKTFLSLYQIMIVLTLIWVIGSFQSFLFNPFFKYLDSIVILSRYLFFFILSLAFYDFGWDPDFVRKCKSIFETFLFINSILIFTGFVFDLDVFSTYDPLGEINSAEQRFGYKGLLYGGNDVAVIYLIGVAYLFRQTFKYGEAKLLLLLFVCITTLFTGTKAAWAGTILISLYFVFKYKTQLIVPGIIVTLVGASFVNWAAFKERYLTVLIERYKSSDLITFIMTNRNEYILKNFEFMNSKWTTLNFITGDAYLFSETDFIDLYFFFGLGVFLYLYIYTRIFFIKDKSVDNIFLFLVLMLMGFIGGHFIQSTTVSLFLLLYIFTAKQNPKSEIESTEKA